MKTLEGRQSLYQCSLSPKPALRMSVNLSVVVSGWKRDSLLGLLPALGNIAAPWGRVPQRSFKHRNLPCLLDGVRPPCPINHFWLSKSTMLYRSASLDTPQNHRLGQGRRSREVCQSENCFGLWDARLQLASRAKLFNLQG